METLTPQEAPSKPFLRRVVADVEHGLADDVRDLDVGAGRHLTGDVHLTGGQHRLDGDPAACGSSLIMASRMESLIWSAILSG